MEIQQQAQPAQAQPAQAAAPKFTFFKRRPTDPAKYGIRVNMKVEDKDNFYEVSVTKRDGSLIPGQFVKFFYYGQDRQTGEFYSLGAICDANGTEKVSKDRQQAPAAQPATFTPAPAGGQFAHVQQGMAQAETNVQQAQAAMQAAPQAAPAGAQAIQPAYVQAAQQAAPPPVQHAVPATAPGNGNGAFTMPAPGVAPQADMSDHPAGMPAGSSETAPF